MKTTQIKSISDFFFKRLKRFVFMYIFNQELLNALDYVAHGVQISLLFLFLVIFLDLVSYGTNEFKNFFILKILELSKNSF